jgi:hypothetical protein
MPANPLPQKSHVRAIADALIAIGFTAHADGTMFAPAGSRVTFTPIGNFLELKIAIDGNVVTIVTARVALKITKEGKS